MVKCPKCNSEKLWAADACHTWPRNDTWMSCQNCFSAVQYTCEDCDWTYCHGLNKNNPRSATNEYNKPDWLSETKVNVCGDVEKHEDVKWHWDIE